MNLGLKCPKITRWIRGEVVECATLVAKIPPKMCIPKGLWVQTPATTHPEKRKGTVEGHPES